MTISSTPGCSHTADPDDDVLWLARRGNATAALRRLMERHGLAVYRYCRAALRDATLAEDTHQQVFIEALRDLPRFAGRARVRAWLFTIARNRVIDAARARGRAHAYLEDIAGVEPPDPRPLPDESIDDLRLRAALAASLGELDDHARTALLLRYQQGFSFEEMAAICGEKPGTLCARVTRALPLLRARIEARVAGILWSAGARRPANDGGHGPASRLGRAHTGGTAAISRVGRASR